MREKKSRMHLSDKERQVLSLMKEKQLERFHQLSNYDKRKLLNRAEKIADKEILEQKQLARFAQKKTSGGSKETAAIKKSAKTIQSGVQIMATCMNVMLAESKREVNEAEEEAPSQTKKAVPARQRPSISRPLSSITYKINNMSHQESILHKKQLIKFQKKKFSNSGFQTMKQLSKKAAGTAKKIGKTVLTVVPKHQLLIVLIFLLLILLLIVVIFGAVSFFGSSEDSSGAYEAQVSVKTESYRSLVETYCNIYEIDDYVDLCLAVIEQESSGNPPDVMQAEQSYYNKKPPIDTPEESINCGVHELSDCLTAAESGGASDIPHISLALQGYNFGNGYIAWAKKNYNGYSAENAVVFSQLMCAKKGYSSYGDVEYVPHVLRYYSPTGKTTISNKKASSLVQELKENNNALANTWRVIEKGASLVGKVSYSMDKRQDDGRDAPTVLDCSSFTAWCFHKAGFSNIPYASSTASFIQSNQFKDISAAELQPGDIGLKSKTAPTGGANHVGIYCGKLKNGTKIWMHCTSSSGTSLTGNNSGVMLGSYSNFTYFRRLKKWQ